MNFALKKNKLNFALKKTLKKNFKALSDTPVHDTVMFCLQRSVVVAFALSLQLHDYNVIRPHAQPINITSHADIHFSDVILLRQSRSTMNLIWFS